MAETILYRLLIINYVKNRILKYFENPSFEGGHPGGICSYN